MQGGLPALDGCSSSVFPPVWPPNLPSAHSPVGVILRQALQLAHLCAWLDASLRVREARGAQSPALPLESLSACVDADTHANLNFRLDAKDLGSPRSHVQSKHEISSTRQNKMISYHKGSVRLHRCLKCLLIANVMKSRTGQAGGREFRAPPDRAPVSRTRARMGTE